MSDSLSPDPHDFTPEDERLLDLLVDGELDEPRRKKLLLSFEEKPSGWRRCALAFLEAQSWGSSFKSLLQPRRAEASSTAREAVVEPAATSPLSAPEVVGNSPLAPPALAIAAASLPVSQGKAEVGNADNGRLWPIRPLSGLAMAASMIVAFTLGLALRSAYAPLEHGSAGAGPGSIVESLSSPTFELAPTMRNMPDAAGDNVRLVVDGDGAARTVEVPLLDDPLLVESFPFRHESAIPVDILKQLEQMGHRVEHRRRLAPVELPDGRRLFLPVEDVKIVPVRRQLY